MRGIPVAELATRIMRDPPRRWETVVELIARLHLPPHFTDVRAALASLARSGKLESRYANDPIAQLRGASRARQYRVHPHNQLLY